MCGGVAQEMVEHTQLYCGVRQEHIDTSCMLVLLAVVIYRIHTIFVQR
jgi:hypothetical protein